MTKKHLYTGIAAGIVIVYLVSSLIVDKRLSDLRHNLDTDISSDVANLTELSDQIANGRQNGTIDSLIQNCPVIESSEYDTMLGGLDKGLTYKELNRLDDLFKLCGHITANKKQVMVYLMEQRLSSLNKAVDRRDLLGNFSKDDMKTTVWAELLEKEKNISNLYSDLVDAQGRIINGLITKVSPEEILSIQAEAQKIKSDLSSTAESASQLRSSLVSS